MTEYRHLRRVRARTLRPDLTEAAIPAVAAYESLVAAARVVNHALDGVHTFGADRAFAQQAEVVCRGFAADIRANRAFGERVVRWLAGQGITQFLDIGCGLPCRGATHEVLSSCVADGAQSYRVAYVDNDPVAVVLADDLLAPGSGDQSRPSGPRTAAILGDLRDPHAILTHRGVAGLLDLDQPIAVLLLGVLAHLPDTDDPAALVYHLARSLAPGSYVALSHPVDRPDQRDQQAALRRLYQRTPTPLHHRTPTDLGELLSGVRVADPGLVAVHEWRPDLAQHWKAGIAAFTIGAVAELHPRNPTHVPDPPRRHAMAAIGVRSP